MGKVDDFPFVVCERIIRLTGRIGVIECVRRVSGGFCTGWRFFSLAGILARYHRKKVPQNLFASRTMFRRFTAIFVLTAAATAAPAQVTSFDLMGVGGVGLLPTNELHTIFGTPGSGGEIGAGISYDAATNQLTINIGWGTGNGFLDLTGSAAAGHIHGFANQNATAGVQVGLDSLAGWNASATAGGFSGTVTLDDTQESQLLLGNMYINVHTATNGGGEMRGNLVPVPEPTLMLALAAGSLAGIRFVRGRFRPVVAMA